MAINYIDTHAHLNLEQFKADREAVFATCAQKSVGVNNVGTNKVNSELAVALAQQYKNTWAIIGTHPLTVVSKDESEAEPVFDYEFYKVLALAPETVGIGECGFDYFHYGDDSYKLQAAAFRAQIALANEVGKPLMLHLRNAKDGQGRNAYNDALEILKSEAKVAGNAHFFAGTKEQAKAFFDLGYTISFTGVITFAQDSYQELVAYAPLDLIHGETDCPYVAPKSYRGQRAEPWMVEEVYQTIASMKGLSLEVVQEELLKNAKRLYGLELD